MLRGIQQLHCRPSSAELTWRKLLYHKILLTNLTFYKLFPILNKISPFLNGNNFLDKVILIRNGSPRRDLQRTLQEDLNLRPVHWRWRYRGKLSLANSVNISSNSRTLNVHVSVNKSLFFSLRGPSMLLLTTSGNQEIRANFGRTSNTNMKPQPTRNRKLTSNTE